MSSPALASSPPSLLTSLLTLITTATHDLQSELAIANLPEPWIDHAELHPWDIETPSKKYWEARRTLVSALGMMTAVVQNPKEKIHCDGMGHHHPAALNFIAKTGIAEILAGPDVDEGVGLPVAEIARRAGVHAAKTERVLRFLCIYHIFQETAPAVFANNKLSACLKKGHSTAEGPLFWGDISFRSATALSETLRAPATAHSVSIEDAPFGVFFGALDNNKVSIGHSDHHPEDDTIKSKYVNGISNHVAKNGIADVDPPRPTLFDFLARPSSAVYRSAFAQGMVTLDVMNGALGYRDFDWGRWDQQGNVIVEVGASTGHLSNTILPLLKHVRFINQDRPEVCLEGEKFFIVNNPEALSSGRVTFQPIDFFLEQPVKGAAIYILANILHDWPDKEVLTILGHITDAMSSASRLLVSEIVIVPALSQSRSLPPSDQKKKVDDAPWPLLKDYGIVNRYPHHQSMEIINVLNGLDRTLEEYVALYEAAGLELVQVHRIRKLVSIMELRKKN